MVCHMENIILVLLCAAGAGAARAAVGSSDDGWWSSRGVMYPAEAVLMLIITAGVLKPGMVGVGVLAISLVAVVANMWLGRTRWESQPYMAARYGVVPALVTIFMAYQGMLTSPALYVWPLASALLGFMYGPLKQLASDKGWSDQVPEFIAGAVVMGGFSLILI